MIGHPWLFYTKPVYTSWLLFSNLNENIRIRILEHERNHFKLLVFSNDDRTELSTRIYFRLLWSGNIAMPIFFGGNPAWSYVIAHKGAVLSIFPSHLTLCFYFV